MNKNPKVTMNADDLAIDLARIAREVATVREARFGDSMQAFQVTGNDGRRFLVTVSEVEDTPPAAAKVATPAHARRFIMNEEVGHVDALANKIVDTFDEASDAPDLDTCVGQLIYAEQKAEDLLGVVKCSRQIAVSRQNARRGF